MILRNNLTYFGSPSQCILFIKHNENDDLLVSSGLMSWSSGFNGLSPRTAELHRLKCHMGSVDIKVLFLYDSVRL